MARKTTTGRARTTSEAAEAPGTSADDFRLSDPSWTIDASALASGANLDGQIRRLLALTGHADRTVRYNAAHALVDIGPPVVPALLEGLSGLDGPAAGNAAWIAGQIGRGAAATAPVLLLGVLSSHDPDTRRLMAAALGRVAPEDNCLALAVLAERSSADSATGQYAVEGLRAAGRGAVAALIAALENPSEEYASVRCDAAAGLGRIGPAAAEAVPALVAALADPDQDLRDAAAMALTQVGFAAVAYLIAVATDGKVPAARLATETLVRIGPAAIPGLLNALTGGDGGVEAVAVAILERIDRPAVRALIETLAMRSRPRRAKVAAAYDEASTDAPAAAAALAAALGEDEYAWDRGLALWALGQLGEGAAAAVPALVGIVEDEDAPDQSAAARALGEIGAAAVAARPALLGLFREGTERQRAAAAEALGRLGYEPFVSATLAAGLGDRVAEVRLAAASALARFGPAAGAHAPVVAKLLGDPDANVREAAVAAVAALGERALGPVHAARASDDATTSTAAVQALARLDPASLAAELRRKRPGGLERMGDKALDLLPDLEVFYCVGAWCRRRGTDEFVFGAMEELMPDLVPNAESVSNSSLRRSFDDVSDLFRAYYARFYGFSVPPDDSDRRHPDAFVSRRAGRRPRFGATGWRAWKEAGSYLRLRGRDLDAIAENVDLAAGKR